MSELKQSVLVVVRTHAGQNQKNRPDWFSKNVCLESLAQSIEHATRSGLSIRSVALVDAAAGPIVDRETLAILQRMSSVREINAGSSRKSWQEQVRVVRSLDGYAESDIVYFVEDDHLHALEAVSCIVSLPSDYGLLYSISKTKEIVSDGLVKWVETMRGVSSFAVKRAAFERDRRILHWMAYAGPAFDLMTWQVLRGRTYFSPSEIVGPFRPKPPFERTSMAKTLWQVSWRLAANLLSSARPRRSVVAVEPSPATHAEMGWLASGTDWEVVASLVSSRGGAGN